MTFRRPPVGFGKACGRGELFEATGVLGAHARLPVALHGRWDMSHRELQDVPIRLRARKHASDIASPKACLTAGGTLCCENISASSAGTILDNVLADALDE